MKKILLCCAAGMSTSLLVNKMKAEAEKRGIEVMLREYRSPTGSIGQPQSDSFMYGFLTLPTNLSPLSTSDLSALSTDDI